MNCLCMDVSTYMPFGVLGLSSWDTEASGCDIDGELNAFVKLQPKGTTDPTGGTFCLFKT